MGDTLLQRDPKEAGTAPAAPISKFRVRSAACSPSIAAKCGSSHLNRPPHQPGAGREAEPLGCSDPLTRQVGVFRVSAPEHGRVAEVVESKHTRKFPAGIAKRYPPTKGTVQVFLHYRNGSGQRPESSSDTSLSNDNCTDCTAERRSAGASKGRISAMVACLVTRVSEASFHEIWHNGDRR